MQLQTNSIKTLFKTKTKKHFNVHICVCVCVYIPIYRSRHINKMLNYLDDIEGEVSPSSCVDGLPNQPVNDEDTGFGTDNSQSTTPTLPPLTSGSELFGSLFTELNRKPDEIAVVANCSFAFKQQQQKVQGQEQDKEQGYQHQHHDEQHYLRRQQSFQYHQDNSNGVKSDDEVGVGGGNLSGRLLKRKKLECNHVELDNDDACSEDEFIRKIATVVADNKEATRIISVQTLNNSNNKFICNTNNHEPK